MALRWVTEIRKKRLRKSGTNETQDWSRDGEQVIWGPGGRLMPSAVLHRREHDRNPVKATGALKVYHLSKLSPKGWLGLPCPAP